MKKITGIDEAVEEFRRQAKPFVVESDLASLKELFARTSADARASNPDEQWHVVRAMRETLRDVFLESTHNVKSDFFEDL